MTRAGGWLLALLVLAALAVAPVFATETVSAPAIRAALLFNFIKFTEWPATDGDSPLRVCIATSDPTQFAAIEALEGRLVRGKALDAVRMGAQADCGVIYVDSRQRWNELAQQGGSRNALTIGSYAGFAADGGMIEISLKEGHATFDINQREAKRAGLRFYPQLLRLARHITE